MQISDLNYLLALGTVATQILTVGLLVIFLLRKKVAVFGDIAESVGNVGMWGGVFGVAHRRGDDALLRIARI